MMRLHVKAGKLRFRLCLPLSLLSGKTLMSLTGGDKKELRELFSRQNMRTLRSALKSYTKKYGHFTLFHCEAEDTTVTFII